MAKRRTSVTRAATRPGAVKLSHVQADAFGSRARMVDVGKKPVEERSAVARAWVRFPGGLRDAALAGLGPKGPIVEVARCAGILAAKRTSELIPLCHSLALDQVEIAIEPLESDRLEVRCRARTTARTGVEMEALTGAALAALTVYDMTKALDKGIQIERLELLEKTGGKSGGWSRGRSQQA